MKYLELLPVMSFFFCSFTALFVFFRSRQKATFFALGLGIASLGLMDLANFMCLRAFTGEKVLFWQRLSLTAEMLFAANLLLFSILFGKRQLNKALIRWKWVLPPIYLLSGILLLSFLVKDQGLFLLEPRIIKLSNIAKYFHILLLAMVIISLVNLEKTFRSSSGLDRWKIKYLLFSCMAILIFYIYILCQRVLYNAIDLNNIYIFSSATLIATILLLYSILIQKVIDRDIFLSRKVIYSSISLITVGLYGILVSILTHIITSFEISFNMRLNSLVIFIAFLLLTVFFYKESLRRRIKSIINRHFQKSKYVYRDEWIIFSTELSKKLSTEEVCAILIKTLAERIFTNNLSLWLFDENQLCFSAVSFLNIEKPKTKIKHNDKLIRYLKETNDPFNISDIWSNKRLQPMSKEISILINETQAELIVPLILADRWVGLLTLGKIQTGESYDREEDYDLVKSVAAHAASSINNAILFEKNMKARELETFNKFSCFVVHDLKNVISMLSMATENAKEHLSNPEFQKDAFQSISTAVARMRKILASLSTSSCEVDELSGECADLDLNGLIDETVDGIARNGFVEVVFERELEPLPKVSGDRAEIGKVFENLLLNACEAVNGRGHIKISGKTSGDYVVIKVSDNGAGMSREFIENSLFQPFKSTKVNGYGVGLYQCRTIVEAHGGKIEAGSVLGVGSKFSVYLPVSRRHNARPVLTQEQGVYQGPADLGQNVLEHSCVGKDRPREF